MTVFFYRKYFYPDLLIRRLLSGGNSHPLDPPIPRYRRAQSLLEQHFRGYPLFLFLFYMFRGHETCNQIFFQIQNQIFQHRGYH